MIEERELCVACQDKDEEEKNPCPVCALIKIAYGPYSIRCRECKVKDELAAAGTTIAKNQDENVSLNNNNAKAIESRPEEKKDEETAGDKRPKS
jgi:predicted  nucleic acid-binding Zn-ribbon protein